MRGLHRCGALIMFAAALAGCATAPPPKPPAIETPVGQVPAGPSELERAVERRRSEALKFEQSHDLVDAARQWQVVLLLAPRDSQAAERIASLRTAIAQIVKDELAAQRDALRRGDTEQAQRSLLRVLALDAHNEEAVGALRELDRRRELRLADERSARARLSQPAAARHSPPRATSEAREFDLEQDLEMLRAGNATVALPGLRRYVATNPHDSAARTRIASAVYAHAQRLEQQGAFEAAVAMYAEAIGIHPAAPREWSNQFDALKKRLAGVEYDKGVRLLATDVGAAIEHFEAALRIAPDHTQAQLQLQRARKMQQNLRAITPAKTAP